MTVFERFDASWCLCTWLGFRLAGSRTYTGNRPASAGGSALTRSKIQANSYLVARTSQLVARTSQLVPCTLPLAARTLYLAAHSSTYQLTDLDVKFIIEA